jgi:hypothetical protein
MNERKKPRPLLCIYLGLLLGALSTPLSAGQGNLGLRKHLEPPFGDWDGLKTMEIGRQFAATGGTFVVLPQRISDEIWKISKPKAGKEPGYLYAMEFLKDRIVQLSKKPWLELQQQLISYGEEWFIDQYFTRVDELREGDLAAYFGGEHQHAGVVRLVNGSIAVESWWNRKDLRVVFLHDPLFVPLRYGDSVAYFRIKNAVDLDLNPIVSHLCLNGTKVPTVLMAKWEGQTLAFDPSLEQPKGLRDQISRLSATRAAQRFPEILTTHTDVDFGVGLNARCYHFAMSFIFKENLGKIPAYDMPFIMKYFELTMEPKPGDLVLYFANDIETAEADLRRDSVRFKWSPRLLETLINHVRVGTAAYHFGIYLGGNWVHSKWGSDRAVTHAVFAVGDDDGNWVRFYRLKVPVKQVLQELKRSGSPVPSKPVD